MKAQVHRSAPRRRVIRTAKTAQAAEALGELTPGCEIFVLTFGQFSLSDALWALTEKTGPADVTLATWTAAATDLHRAAELLEISQIRSLRLIVDQTILSRMHGMPYYLETLRRLFGEGSIRTSKSHAKWATIKNEKWNIAVRTSMNLNSNPRLENLEISDDPALCGFLDGVADQIFDEQDAGVRDADLPLLRGMSTVDPPRIESGKMELAGLRRVNVSG